MPSPWTARGVCGWNALGRVGDERGCRAQHLGLRGSQEPGPAGEPHTDCPGCHCSSRPGPDCRFLSSVLGLVTAVLTARCEKKRQLPFLFLSYSFLPLFIVE